ncbi:sodium:proton antiporter [Terrihabitans soli]|uniref:Sodium:proton antiporter n=1 Tax=Terrihabitans soli TaxID=708113 RepID=A0A6S6QZL4_9HYPH|nr:YbaL family putative K(+) efflux transporter [Terrihabitans soli]BCJ92108.1 sodium:proton antiporter [Terrihabitans soli]
MPHHTPLIATIVAGLGIAFIFGTIAHRLKLPPIAGYLLAGVLIGPFTPGYVADQGLALELAEIGVILLMFGVGLHFSLKDLLSVRAIAIPGAIGQIAIATVMGVGLAWALGWSLGAGLVLGLSLSVASTVVLLKALQDRRLVETERGRIAVGWLIVEDLVMVLTLVVLPAIAGLIGGREVDAAEASGGAGLAALFGPLTIWHALALTALKLIAFVALMIVVGRRLVPFLLHYVAHTGSRELFRLAVLAIALGIAFGSAQLFGVSFALGAFFAGMILAESQLSHQAAQETLPLRDAFAVLFFVSAGMLFDPNIVLSHPIAVIVTVLIITLGKSAAAYFIVRAFKHSHATALTISASLAQIGEFSFILAGLGVSLALLPEEGRSLIMAGAIISILLNPVFFAVLDRYLEKIEPKPDKTPISDVANSNVADSTLTGHAVIIGYGRVGKVIVDALLDAGVPMVVTDEREEAVAELRKRGIPALSGNAGERGMLEATNLKAAKWFISAIPSPFETGGLIEHARKENPGLDIVVRAHSEAEIEYLQKAGASRIINVEHEAASAMIQYVLGRPADPKMDATP